MNLALFPRRWLAARYPPAELAGLDQALARWLTARAGAGLTSRAYDPEEGLADLGVPPATLTPRDLAGQLGAVDAALGQGGAIIESLTIIGGPQAVPFASFPNPVPDGDGPIASDGPYGLAVAGGLPRWPVGRIPDADPHAPGLLAAQLERAAALHRRPTPPATRAIGISTERWRAASAEVLAVTEAPAELLVFPTDEQALDRGLLQGAGLIYCNLHGTRSGAAWYGQGRDDSSLMPVIWPEDLKGLDLYGTIVVSQACYGARLGQVQGRRPLAVAFLEQGARAFVGATALTYGAILPPLSESDLLARHLLAAVTRPGARLGPAFLEAHTTMLREMLSARGFLDADEVKTLSAFVLYGDPALPTGLSAEGATR